MPRFNVKCCVLATAAAVVLVILTVERSSDFSNYIWPASDTRLLSGVISGPACVRRNQLRGALPPVVNGEIVLSNSSADDIYFTFESRPGGWWRPTHCQSDQAVAVIIPYRDRAENLRVLLQYLHPMLQRQLLHYRIFVVEQNGNDTYNKGMLMNSGFVIIRKEYPAYDCFIFHDVDMLPENDRNLYICGNNPRHLSPAVEKFNYSLPYKELVGGVLAFTRRQFEAVNGYANVYFGWGGEDDDMYYRLTVMGYKVERPSMGIGRYTMLPHVKRTWIAHSKTYALLSGWRARQRKDGINNVKYKVISSTSHQFHTHITVQTGT